MKLDDFIHELGGWIQFQTRPFQFNTKLLNLQLPIGEPGGAGLALAGAIFSGLSSHSEISCLALA